ncbi:RsmE family RNA methyltransferase [Membranihabitans marinus]|uniref:RsmE family RNA methyltransferase n=1 Tax=Membranihabitans marinus TaxID=1227546 RepID=UPI001F29923F|nr:RsmE family RNA methyltransferase [Membranihabitans marinus]
MSLFLATKKEGDILEFEGDVVQHISKSFRMQVGHQMKATDGQGSIYDVEITALSRQKITARIIQSMTEEPSLEIHVAMAILKKEARLENFVEKATELGVSAIHPLQCRHSIKQSFRKERTNKILIAAAQQSMNPYLPTLHEVKPFASFIEEYSDLFEEKYIAYAPERNNNVLLETRYSGSPKVCVIIGPEGDFHEEELKLAVNNGWQFVSLGNTRLRAETAGMMCVQILKTAHNLKV